MHCTHPRHGSLVYSSSSSSTQWPLPPNLDGAPNEDPSGASVQLSKTKDETTIQPSIKPWSSSSNVSASVRQPGRVADRIRAINSLSQLPSIVPIKTKDANPLHIPQVNVPPKDEINRASPFPRRDSAQSPVRPETPFSQSRSPINPLVHCPMPKRFQPHLSANIEKGTRPNSSDRLTCHRHGRKLRPRKSAPAGMDKAYSGAYIPTGHLIRQQVDTLSPWAVGRRLAKTSGTTVSPDVCPDCLAEQDIMKREAQAGTSTPYSRANQPIPTASSSTFTERGTPPDPVQPSNVLVGTTIDNQSVKIPGATVTDLPPNKFGGIVATDLGDMIDAIIVEHSGSLGKVISNIRTGMPDSDWTQKISRDLAKVSEAVAALPEDDIKRAPAFSRSINGRRSIILDASPESLRKRARTMPELLDLVDAATEEFGLTRSHQERLEFHDDSPRVPGDFPYTPSVLTPTAIAPSNTQSTAPPTMSTQSIASDPPLPLSQPLGQIPRSEPSQPLSRPNDAFTAITTARKIEFLPFEADEDEATLMEIDEPLSSEVLPSRSSQGQVAPVETTSHQQRSRIPRATTIPLTRSSHASSTTLHPTSARPQPSTIAKQHQQQRTFQQGWLRDAAIAERAERRSRSRGANRREG